MAGNWFFSSYSEEEGPGEEDKNTLTRSQDPLLFSSPNRTATFDNKKKGHAHTQVNVTCSTSVA